MWANAAAAEILDLTPSELQAALDRGETVATLAEAAGVDIDMLTDAVVDAELADIDALARIAGFSASDIRILSGEIRVYLGTMIRRGSAAADSLFDGRAIAAA